MSKTKPKLYIILLVCIVLLAMLLVSCNVKVDATIKFYLDDQLYCEVIVVNGEFEMPAAPTKTGYTFVGWYLDKNYNQALDLTFATDEKIGAGAVVYAKFIEGEVVDCDIFLEPNNGQDIIEFSLTEDNYIFPTVYKRGYDFVGWYSDKSLSLAWDNFDTLSDGDTLYAGWKYSLPNVLINFQTNGGSEIASSYYDVGSKIKQPVCARENYNLVGWYADEQLTQPWNFSSDTVQSSATLYAKWQLKNFNVNVYGRSNILLDSYTIEYGSNIKTLPTLATDGNYSFSGWFLDAVGSMPIDQNYIVTKDINIWSKWKEHKEQIAINYVIDGDVIFSATNDKDGLIVSPYQPKAVAGKSFIGWFVDSYMTQLYDFTKQTVEQQLNLYGAYKTPTAGLSMIYLPDDSYAVSGYQQGAYQEVVIPEFYNNRPVVEITSFAFSNLSCQKFYASRNIKRINSMAFESAQGLVSVYLPSDIEHIQSDAFYNVNGLASINLDARNQSYTMFEDALYSSDFRHLIVYETQSSRQAVNIHENTMFISAYAFANAINLKRVYIGDNMHAIGDYAFANNKKLEKLVFSGSLYKIGVGAFKNCTALKELNLPKKVNIIEQEAFYGNDSIIKLVLPQSCDKISEKAFYGLRYLEKVTIPASIAVIQRKAFDNCGGAIFVNYPNTPSAWAYDWTNSKNLSYSKGITSQDGQWQYVLNNDGLIITEYLGHDSMITVPYQIDNVKVVAMGAIFADNSTVSRVVIDAEITEISAYSFQNASKLGSIVLPNSLLYIGEYAFYKCASLTSLTLRASVRELGEGAFMNCSSLQRVELSVSMLKINKNTFANCTMLSNIKLNDVLKYLGDSAFYNCTSLQSITWNNNLQHIGEWTFYNCSRLKSVILPQSLLSIGANAFNSCAWLSNAYISKNVNSVGDGAFSRCVSLNRLTFDNDTKLNTIGNSAFSGCLSLEKVDLPNSLVKLKSDAFIGASALKEISFGNSLIEIGANAFKDCNLQYVDMPSSLRYLGDQAFANNRNMEYAIVSVNIIRMSTSGFVNISDMTIYIKDGILVNYWGAWSSGNEVVLDGAWHYNQGIPVKNN